MQIAYNDYLICNYEKYGIKHADRVVAVSNYTAERLKEFFHAENVEVIHNGIDTDYFTPGQAGNTPSRFRLLFVGKPSRMKGFDMLGSVMKRLGDDFELIYTSPGKGTTSMHPGNMHTSGYLYGEDLLRAYRDCDALISPSRLEGFGYSVCEAMACGKPVIVSDNSSLSEIVQHGETGFLCPTDDVDAFAEAARKLAGDPLLAGRMGEAARQHVLKHFRIESMIERYIRLYQSLAP